MLAFASSALLPAGDLPETVTLGSKEPPPAQTFVMRRVNTMLDRLGTPVGRTVSEGEVSFQPTEVAEPGRWAGQVAWKRFGFTQKYGTLGDGTALDRPEGAGVEYPWHPTQTDPLNHPGDFARIPDSEAAYAMQVLAMDFGAFMNGASGLPLLQPVPLNTVRTGAAWTTGQKIEVAGSPADRGSYRLGQNASRVLGLTTLGGELCVLVESAAMGNVVQQKMDRGPVKIDMSGTEYFKQICTFSLVDGRLVAAELWGLMPMVLKMGDGEVPIASVWQDVTLVEQR